MTILCVYIAVVIGVPLVILNLAARVLEVIEGVAGHE